jgi:uncharacterized protein YodC (DUF2158 family)
MAKKPAAAAPQRALKVSDTVQAIIGGPKMLIHHINKSHPGPDDPPNWDLEPAGHCVCRWFNRGRMYTEIFAPEALRLVEKSD